MPDLPLKGTKFSETEEISFIGSKHGDSHAPGAHGDNAIVCQPRLSNAVKAVPGSNSREDSTGRHPIAKIWNKNVPIKAGAEARVEALHLQQGRFLQAFRMKFAIYFHK